MVEGLYGCDGFAELVGPLTLGLGWGLGYGWMVGTYYILNITS